MKKIRNLPEGSFLKLLFAFWSAFFLIAAFFMPDRANMLSGLWQILSQPSKLSTSYCALGGYAATFLNMGLIGLISLALFLTVQPGKHSRKSVFYYFAVFILNGLYGVVTALHQKLPELAVDSQSFSAMSSLFAVIIAVGISLIKLKKFPVLKKPEIKFAGLFGIFCGTGNLLSMIALKYLNASVQFPIITGGTMVVSTLICLLRKETLTKRDILATVIAFGASVLIAL